jgi:hypothetical protein
MMGAARADPEGNAVSWRSGKKGSFGDQKPAKIRESQRPRNDLIKLEFVSSDL